MATTVGTQTDLNELLESLIELDFDAAEAYEAAIDRLDDPERKRKLGEFRADHLRHTNELGKILQDSGRTPPSGGDFKRMLTKGKVVMAALAGDKAILKAMKTNEDDTNTAYERAVNNDIVPAQVRDTLRGGLADERRHRDWIVSEIAKMP